MLSSSPVVGDSDRLGKEVPVSWRLGENTGMEFETAAETAAPPAKGAVLPTGETAAAAAEQSVVVVLVPEAEPVVGRHRAVLDGAAAVGMPAHVTVLYPFVAPPAITEATLSLLADAVGSVAAFDCVFGRTAWFDERVLWLAPDPDGPFHELTRAVVAAFPGYLPYDGAFPDVIPHLTIGEQPPGGPAALRAAEADVLPDLPVTARISRVCVMTGSSAANSWHPIAELPLAAPGWQTPPAG